MVKDIDIQSWSRRQQYENFRGYTNPTFSVSTRIDVTELVTYCKEEKKSFFSTFLFVISQSINKIEEFRIRMLHGRPVMYDVVHPSFVVLCENKSLVTTITNFSKDFECFYWKNQSDITKARQVYNQNQFNSTNRNDCIYISSLPWIDVTSVRDPYNLSDVDQTSIPRLTWGKYIEKEGRYEIGFNVSADHSLVDGAQIADLIREIEEDIKFWYEGRSNERQSLYCMERFK